LPTAGTTVCDTIAGTPPVHTCAAITSVTLGTQTARRLVLTGSAIEGAVVRTDTTTLDRVPDAAAPPL
jgi:hypothetical protein